MDLSAKYSFVNMVKSGLRDTQEVNQVLIGDVKIQSDVRRYMQLHDYDDFRGFDVENEY